MRISRFYDQQALAEGKLISLSEGVVQHVYRVLRLKIGDQILLFNGDGQEYTAHLETINKHEIFARIGMATSREIQSDLQIRIGQGLSRGERMDYAIQKATEMGMQQMYPLFSERCEVKLDEKRRQKRHRHWQQVAISACEQSGRCTVPKLHMPLTLEEWVQQESSNLKLVLHQDAQPLQSFKKPKSVALLIGPEGGLSNAELEVAKTNGFHSIALGPRILRTETAPVAALSLLQHLWGDWQ